MYTEPLSDAACCQLLAEFPEILGLPVGLMIGSIFTMMISLSVYIQFFYGWVYFVNVTTEFLGIMAGCGLFAQKVSKYRNILDPRSSKLRERLHITEMMSVEEVAEILERKGLGQYSDMFRKAKIYGEVAMMMSDDDFASVLEGVPFGDRMRLRKRIRMW